MFFLVLLYTTVRLIDDYDKAITDRNHWLRRCKWAADRGLINDCHEKVKNDQILLMLALFSEKGYMLKTDIVLVLTNVY